VEDWGTEASGLRGMKRHHQEMTRFFSARWLDALAPTNIPWLHPEVLVRTAERSGANLVQGAHNALDGWRRHRVWRP
jgi:polyhydroxyalkanoate synthase subunit PhaC